MLKVIATSQFCHDRAQANKALRAEIKQQFGILGRRLDNFTLAGIGATAKLREQISSFEAVSLLSCAEYFSIELLQSLIVDIEHGEALRPLDFVATVGNAANYYIAKEFSVFGTNLFLGCSESSLWKAQKIAEADLTCSNQAVIILIWHETEQTRSCYALLAQQSSESGLQQLSTKSLQLSEMQNITTPFTLID